MDQEFRDKLLIEVATNQKAIQVQLEDIKQDLKLHMRRSAANEELIRLTELRIDKELGFLKKHVYFVQGAMGFIALLATLVGIVKAFVK